MFSSNGAHFKWETCQRPSCVLVLLDAINLAYKTDPATRSTLKATVISECTLENGAYYPR